MNLLLNVERRRVTTRSDQSCWSFPRQISCAVRDVDIAGLRRLLDLLRRQADTRALPDELRVEIGVTRTGFALGQRMAARVDDGREGRDFLGALRSGLKLGSRDILALGLPCASASRPASAPPPTSFSLTHVPLASFICSRRWLRRRGRSGRQIPSAFRTRR